MPWLLLTLLTLLPPAAAVDTPEAALSALLARAFPDGEAPLAATDDGSRAGFFAVLESELFLHRAVGPFDLYVMGADGLATPDQAQATLDAAAAGLEPVLPVLERQLVASAGLVGGQRFPIVLASSDRGAGQTGFDELVGLLHWAEADYSGWLQGGNPLFHPSLLTGLTARTWEVQLFNLAHEYAASQGQAFLDHGLGYYTLAHLVARLTRQGAWGMVPPWLAQGLIDELDIQAYEQAWVGQDFQLVERAGWYREGWSGFVPQGASPPPPVVGPPRDLAVTVSRSGDSWQHRDFSTERHWEHLVADRKSEAPVSFAFMALNESFLPRDRAAARCALHLLLEGALTSGRPGLLEQLDRIPSTPPSGMPDADPITVVVARALGGVPAVDELEALGAGDLAARLERPDLADQLAHLGALELLRIADHREQAEWLYGQTMDVMDGVTRQAIWTLILELEYYQQLLEWELIGEALDGGLFEALDRSKRYPTRDRDRDKVLAAFWSGLGHED